MPDGPVLRLPQTLGIKLAGRPGDDRQDRADHALPADVEHRPDPLYLGQLLQPAGQPANCREPGLLEEAALRPADANNAVAVGAAKPFADGIDDREFLVDRGRGRSRLSANRPHPPQQRPQIVVDPNAADTIAGQGRDDENR